MDMAAEEEQAPPVAAGHKRRSSPTDLESAEAALLGIMAADFPPTPAAGAVQGSGQLGPPARPQQPQQEQDGATAPIYHRTPSITAALATLLNPEAKVRGATVAVKPSIGETYSVTLWRKHATTTVGRLERHTAAVAADLKEVWKAIADAAEVCCCCCCCCRAMSQIRGATMWQANSTHLSSCLPVATLTCAAGRRRRPRHPQDSQLPLCRLR